MNIRKIIKTGHSLAVTIPKKIAQILGLKVGENLEVDLNEEENKILLKIRGRHQAQLKLPFSKKKK